MSEDFLFRENRKLPKFPLLFPHIFHLQTWYVGYRSFLPKSFDVSYIIFINLGELLTMQFNMGKKGKNNSVTEASMANWHFE